MLVTFPAEQALTRLVSDCRFRDGQTTTSNPGSNGPYSPQQAARSSREKGGHQKNWLALDTSAASLGS
jgi:hypothetical protein